MLKTFYIQLIGQTGYEKHYMSHVLGKVFMTSLTQHGEQIELTFEILYLKLTNRLTIKPSKKKRVVVLFVIFHYQTLPLLKFA